MSSPLSSILRTDGLHVLNTESAKGFIIIIDNKYVLKFCILSDDPKEFPKFNKFSTSLFGFNDEAHEQQRAYLLTQVCPPILFTKILANKSALDYFWLIEKRCGRTANKQCISTFHLLQEAFNADDSLKCGIIAMPYVEGVAYKDTKQWPINIRRQIIVNCIVNVVNLYRNANRIHGDLHETNIIVNQRTLECQFIDFDVMEYVESQELNHQVSSHQSPPFTKTSLKHFLHEMEPWLEFLSGDTTFYKIGSNRKRIYDSQLIDMCLMRLNQ